jgi:ferredoxin
MMKIELDRAKCTGIGMCESVAPNFFEIDDDGELVVHRVDANGDDEVADVEAAVRACPTAALRLSP